MENNNIIKKLAKTKILNTLKINDSFIFNKVSHIFDDFEMVIKETELFPFSENEYIYSINTIYKLDNEIFISVKLDDELSEECRLTDIIFFYTKDKNIEKINIIIEELKKGIFSTDEQYQGLEGNLSYISISKNNFSLNKLYLDNEIDFNICYNKKTFKELKKISKEIKDNSGLWILTGIKGSGKTSSLQLISSFSPNKKFIYIPTILVDSVINSIDIFEFIKENGDCVFIIDDMETIFDNFDIKGSYLIQNLSQLIDNFLFEKNKLSFIIISNEENSSYLNYLKELNNFKYEIIFKGLERSNISDILDLKKITNTSLSDNSSLSDVLNNKRKEQKKYTGF